MMTNNNSNALEIKVLWINDTKEGENPIDLIDAAAEYSIDLVQHEYVESGISALKDASKTWHAVVLDANCKISSENEVPMHFHLQKMNCQKSQMLHIGLYCLQVVEQIGKKM